MDKRDAERDEKFVSNILPAIKKLVVAGLLCNKAHEEVVIEVHSAIPSFVTSQDALQLLATTLTMLAETEMVASLMQKGYKVPDGKV